MFDETLRELHKDVVPLWDYIDAIYVRGKARRNSGSLAYEDAIIKKDEKDTKSWYQFERELRVKYPGRYTDIKNYETIRKKCLIKLTILLERIEISYRIKIYNYDENIENDMDEEEE